MEYVEISLFLILDLYLIAFEDALVAKGYF